MKVKLDERELWHLLREARARSAALEAGQAAACREAYLLGAKAATGSYTWVLLVSVRKGFAEEAERLWPSAGKAEEGPA